MERRKFLVLATAAAALLLLAAGAVYEGLRMPKAILLDTSGYPTIGNTLAKIEMILFEDFRCSHCCTFSKEIFPQINSKYIATGQVRYTIVPLAFLKGSKPIATAALSVFHSSPSRLVPFLDQIATRCQNGDILDERSLLGIAKGVGNINLEKLRECLDTQCYNHELEKNLQMAHKIMGKDFGTPSLYVNGVLTSTASFRSVQARVETMVALMDSQAEVKVSQ